MSEDEVIKIIATNRRAWHDYHIEDRLEAGLVLGGTEVKSLRAGRASLVDCYVSVSKGEAFIYNLQISPYEQGNRYNMPEKRPRKLLLHKSEIEKMMGQISRKGYTVAGLKLYFKGSRVKLELGMARGKKDYDKREDMKERDSKRELDRVVKASRRG